MLHLPPMMKRWISTPGVLEAGGLLLSLAVWELIAQLDIHHIVPSPLDVLVSIVQMLIGGDLADHAVRSMSRVLLAVSMSATIAIPIGFAAGLSEGWRRFVSVPIETIRPIPPIAWIPLSIAFFGISESNALFVIFIGAFFPIFTNTYLGLTQVEQAHVDLARVMNIPKHRVLSDIFIPSILPNIFSGLRMGLGFGWMCVVAAEMVGSNSGIGYLIQFERQLLHIDRVVAGMVTIGAVGFTINFLLHALEYKVVPWSRARRRTHRPNTVAPQQDDERNHYSTILGDSLKPQDHNGAICAIGVSLSYGQFCVAKNINLEVSSGKILAVVGRSGSGKSTLLRAIAGLHDIENGTIEVSHRAAHDLDGRVSLMFQETTLLPWKTVLKNVSFGLINREHSTAARNELAMSLLALVGVRQQEGKYPWELSGGQRQRVALVQALASRPQVLLMDEPFSSLDMITRGHVRDEISQMIRSLGITVVLVTHDTREAVDFADQILAIRGTDGSQWGDFDGFGGQANVDVLTHERRVASIQEYLNNEISE